MKSLCPFAGTCALTCLSRTGQGGIPSRVWNAKEPLTLLSKGNTKLEKSHTVGMSLLPHTRYFELLSGGTTFFNMPERARFMRTHLLQTHPAEFHFLLDREIERVPRNTWIRLNVISDVDFRPVALRHPSKWFYGYTKVSQRLIKMPENYRDAYSLSERTSRTDLDRCAVYGQRLSVVADSEESAEWMLSREKLRDIQGNEWYPVDATSSDRWIGSWDSRPLAGILEPKGKLKKTPNAFSLAWKEFLK